VAAVGVASQKNVGDPVVDIGVLYEASYLLLVVGSWIDGVYLLNG